MLMFSNQVRTLHHLKEFQKLFNININKKQKKINLKLFIFMFSFFVEPQGFFFQKFMINILFSYLNKI